MSNIMRKLQRAVNFISRNMDERGSKDMIEEESEIPAMESRGRQKKRMVEEVM